MAWVEEFSEELLAGAQKHLTLKATKPLLSQKSTTQRAHNQARNTQVPDPMSPLPAEPVKSGRGSLDLWLLFLRSHLIEVIWEVEDRIKTNRPNFISFRLQPKRGRCRCRCRRRRRRRRRRRPRHRSNESRAEWLWSHSCCVSDLLMPRPNDARHENLPAAIELNCFWGFCAPKMKNWSFQIFP